MDQGEAIVAAAKIAARAAQTTAVVGAIGAFAAVIGASITGAIAYLISRRQLQPAEDDRRDAQAAAKADLKRSVRSTITTVESALSTYRAGFEKPVELRVLPLPTALGLHDRKDFYFLGPEVIESIGIVEVGLNDYRRAKQPIQDKLRESGDNRPVVLKDRPDGFDAVINATGHYRAVLIALDQLL
jgi:hypothetical protein